MFGDLEKAYSAISERPVRRFWRFGENLFGEIVVGDLEKTFADFGDLEKFDRRNHGRRFREIVWRFCIGARYGVS